MELIKQIIESIGNLLKNFTKESNKVKVFLYLLGFILIFFIGYYFYNLQQETIKSNLEFQKIAQEEKNKRIEAELEKDKLQAQNQGKVIDSMKDLKSDNEIGGNVNGNVGDNNQTTNQSNSGGVILANSSIENSPISIVNIVLSDYTKYSSGELSKYITDLKNNDSLKIADADEIIKQVSNTPTNTDEEKQKQEDLINTLFQKFSFDTKGKTSWVRFKSYIDEYKRYDYRIYNGCNLQIEKIEPFYKNEKFSIKITFGIEKPKENKKYCEIFFPKEIKVTSIKNETGFYFYGNTATNLEGNINYSEKYPSGRLHDKDLPFNFIVELEGKRNLLRDFSLNDTKNLNIKYNYIYTYFYGKKGWGGQEYNDNGYFIWKVDEKYGVSLLESK